MSESQPAPLRSAFTRAVTEARGAPRTATPEAWQQWLDGAERRGEFRRAERDWSGVDLWLAGQPGAVTREALTAFVKENELQVHEVLRHQDAPAGMTRAELGAEYERIIGYNPIEDDPSIDTDELRGMIADLYATMVRELDAAELPAHWTLHSQVAVPGGQAYRELLLMLPPGSTGENHIITFRSPEAAEQFLHDVSVEGYEHLDYGTTGSDNECQVWFAAPMPEEAYEWVSEYGGKVSGARPTASDFIGTHWKEPNVLVHLRFDERQTSDGTPVLLCHEVQSDWHQRGRREGYRQHDLMVQKIGAGWEVYNRGHERTAADESGEEAITSSRDHVAALVDRVRRDPSEATRGGVPDAPFKTTEQWVMLGMKRLVRWAAENGFQHVAWPTGDAVAEAMGESWTAKAIDYAQREDGTFNIDTLVEGGSPRRRVGVRAADLGKEVGPTCAARILAGEGEPVGEGRRRLEAPELRDGGPGLVGLRGFYDELVPRLMGRFAKPFGSRVERIEVGEGKRHVLSVMSVEVTPAMREAALAGLPMFRRDRARSAPRFLDTASVEAEVEAFVERYRGNTPLDIAVADTQEAAFGPHATIERVGRIKGAYFASQRLMVVCAGSVTDAADVSTTLRHEILGHFGLNTFAPIDKAAMLDRLIDARNSPGLRPLWEHVEKHYRPQNGELPLSPRQKAEEVFALAAEAPEPSKLGAAWIKVLSLFVAALRRAGLVRDSITLTEVQAAVVKVGEQIRDGTVVQRTVPLRDDAQFSRVFSACGAAADDTMDSGVRRAIRGPGLGGNKLG